MGRQGCSVSVWNDPPFPLKVHKGAQLSLAEAGGLTRAQKHHSARLGLGLLHTGENKLVHKPPLLLLPLAPFIS